VVLKVTLNPPVVFPSAVAFVFMFCGVPFVTVTVGIAYFATAKVIGA
jgi:hypothetical protein